MEQFSPEQVAKLAEAVAARLVGQNAAPVSGALQPRAQYGFERPPHAVNELLRTGAQMPKVNTASRGVVFATLDEAVEAAREAQPHWAAIPLERRKEVISQLRLILRNHVNELSYLAVEETGLGRVEDKIKKNLLVINKTPGPEYLEPGAFTGDDGLALVEFAPFGVIGSITPTTNPSETIINNAISMLSGGNAVVFNPHPSAKKVSIRTLEIINQAIVSMGGPASCATTVSEPTIDTAQALMKHPGIRLLVVTGGPAVVKAAMASGKKVIAAGPGNPPVVVDETADLDQAAAGIVAGASLDNNIVCIAEKEIIAVKSIAEELKRRLQKAGGYLLNEYQVRQLEKVVLDQDTVAQGKFPYPNKKYVGKSAHVILEQIGVHTGPDTRIIFCEVDEKHPFVQAELLMPVIPMVTVPNVDEAIRMAKRVEHGFGHTAVMYSKNIDNLHKMARIINTSIFVKNAPSFAGLGLGGEGFTSFTIASPTGEGLTTCRTFSRIRRCTLKDHFRIV